MNNGDDILIKCIFLGRDKVGKTSIIQRYTTNTFGREYLPTISADFTTIPILLDPNKDITDFTNEHRIILERNHINEETLNSKINKLGKNFKILIWDIAGHAIYKNIRKYYMSKAVLAIMVFDISNFSIDEFNEIYDDIQKFANSSDFIVVLNKIDLVNLKNNKIQNRVKKLSSNNKNSKGYVHLVSAKDGTGLAELFTDIKINIILKLDKLIN